MKTLFFAAFGATLLLAGQASAADSCLRIGRIYSWNAPNNKTLIVEDELHSKYKVDLLGICIGLTLRTDIAFKTTIGTQLSCVSRGDSVVYHEGGLGEQRCTVKNVTPYTPEMEAADKAAAAAKATGQSAPQR